MKARLLIGLALVSACAATKPNVTYVEPGFSVSEYQCVAVAPFENQSRAGGAGLLMADSVADAFYASRQFRIIERKEVQRYLSKSASDDKMRLDPSQARILGKALHADAVIIGSVTDYGYRLADAKPEVSVTLRVVDVKSGKVAYVATAEYQPQFASKGPVLLTASSRWVADRIITPLTANLMSRDMPDAKCGIPGDEPVYMVQAPTTTMEIAEPVSKPVAAAAPAPATAEVIATPEPITKETVPVRARAAEPEMTPTVFKMIKRMDDTKNFVMEDVNFELDNTNFRGEEYKQSLDTLGKAMQAKPKLRVRVESHTDGLGDPEFNRKLTEKRAEIIKSYLVTNYQIEPSRIETAGYGGDRPLLPNINRKNRETNRRVELSVLQGP